MACRLAAFAKEIAAAATVSAVHLSENQDTVADSGMVVKFIRVFVEPGRMASYLAAQEIWNRETRNDPACLGSFCGRCEDEPDCVSLLFFWRSREALDLWMATEHDRIAALAKADEHYERIEVRVLDAALPTELNIAKTKPSDV